MLTNLARRLRDDHPGVAASLEESLDETISIKRLRLPEKLERQLSTTNSIENLMGSVRELARRVKRWRGAIIMCALAQHESSFAPVASKTKAAS